jgi:hypothetical protein
METKKLLKPEAQIIQRKHFSSANPFVEYYGTFQSDFSSNLKRKLTKMVLLVIPSPLVWGGAQMFRSL